MRFPLPLVLLVLVAAAGCSGTEEPPVPPVDPDAYLNWGPDATYIGKEKCGECHRENYDTFIGSQMGRSFRPARDSLSQADWTMDEPVLDPLRDLWYQPVRRGEDLFVREFRLAGSDTVHNRLVKIDYIVGSGQHTNSHMREINGYLYQVPMTWYSQERIWGLPPGFDGGDNPRFNRPIPDLCMSCHDGPSDYVEGSENRFTYIPHGIECENCHGPGSVHEEAIRAGRVVNTEVEIDRTIVHPGKLSPELRYDICEKCHMQGAAVVRVGKSPFDFRPGQRLTDYMDVFWPRFPDSVSSFIMASHPDRLAMSECFQASWDEARDLPPMTCVTCHNPHLPVEAKSEFEYNAPCRACHARPDVGACLAPAADRAVVQDDCSSCHLPGSATIDIPNIRITDHYIRVPGPTPEPTPNYAQNTDFIRMASLLRDSVDAAILADGILTYYEQFAHRDFFLDSARAILDRVPPDDPYRERSLIRLLFLEQDWDALRVLVSDRRPPDEIDAWTAYRIGESFIHSGDWNQAIAWLERTVALAPDHVRFLDRLGSTYFSAGRMDDALATYDRVVSRDSTFARTRNNRGFARLMAGDIGGGERDIRAAIRLDPDFEGAIANLASLLFNTGRVEEAMPLARRLVEMSPENLQYRRFLAELSSASPGR